MAEENPEGQGTGQGGTETNPGAGEHKNVSMDDFNSMKNDFTKQISGLTDLIKGLSSNSSGNGQGSDDNNKTGSNESSENNRFDITQDKNYQAMQAKIERLENSQQQSSLKKVAMDAAKENGIKNADSFIDRVIGKDAEETKANVKSMADLIKANTDNSTDHGHQVTSINGKSKNDLFNKGLDNMFGKKK